MPRRLASAAWLRLREGRSQRLSAKALMKRLEKDIAEQTPSAIVASCVISLSRSDQVEAALGLPQCRVVADEVIERVRSTLRAHDYLAMVSPEEIWVVLPRLPTAVMANMAASNLVRALELPVLGGGMLVTVRPAVGIALAAPSGSTPLNMMKVAANAEAHARATGHRYWVDVTHGRSPILDLDVVAHLQRSLLHQGLTVFYQPKVDLASGRIRGVEALVRWAGAQHPEVTPSRAVDTAEQYGLMPELTRFVLNTALREYASLLAGSGIDKVWVNLSASMLRDARLPGMLRQMTELWNVPPQALGLELTESILLTDIDQSIANLNTLVAQGFSLAMDDFGTGYSSLAYLRRLPLTELKIDQLFVRNMSSSLADRQIVRTIIDLAHNFQLAVVAEGVEQNPVLAMLEEMGCDQVQGYVFTKALPARELVQWLRRRDADRPQQSRLGAQREPS